MIGDLITLPETENRLRPKKKLHLPTIHFQWQAVVSFREGEVFVAFWWVRLRVQIQSWGVGDSVVLLSPQYRWKYSKINMEKNMLK